MYPLKAIASFLLVLLLMPLGHALMILMEHFLSPSVLHVSAFLMGFAGMLIVILGVFVKGDTKQTLFGLIGGLLFWTGWVEFLFAYYAQRYGVHYDLTQGVVQTTTQYVDGIGVTSYLINGLPLESYDRMALKDITGSRPEYLIMPATFGMWMMFMMLYLFCARSGCKFMMWLQDHLGIKNRVELRPMAHHTSMVTFLELNLMLWSLYLLLMFCYDPVFLGERHPVTIAVAVGCLVGSLFMFKKQFKMVTWGRNIRMSIATVIVFWTFVEVVARNGMLKEIWVDPLNHVGEMVAILLGFVLLLGLPLIKVKRKITSPSFSIHLPFFVSNDD